MRRAKAIILEVGVARRVEEGPIQAEDRIGPGGCQKSIDAPGADIAAGPESPCFLRDGDPKFLKSLADAFRKLVVTWSLAIMRAA